MAKKRLNKKVALVGSVIFVVLAVAFIWLFLYWGRNPEPFIRDGDAAVKAADEAVDDQIKAEEYKKAERNYQRARSRAKTDSLKIEMLFKLVDVYLETDKWNYVLGCWNKIIQLDPKNVKARFGRLKYFYIMADNGARGYWQEVASQASEFIEVADANLLTDDIAKWESFGVQGKSPAERMGPYLYLLRGRAVLEMTRMGAGTDPDASLSKAIDDLEKVRELEPDNVEAYWYLAQAVITKAELLASRGNLEERKKAVDDALELLEQAVEVADTDVKAHINLLTMKLILARRGPDASGQIQSLESEYLSFVQKFSSSAEAYSALAGFYQTLGHKSLDKAVDAIEKAVELDRENVVYAISAANLHYRKFSIYGQEPQLYKAIEIARNALTLPDAQEGSGPQRWANKMNRASLCVFLANCYIGQVLESQYAGIKIGSKRKQELIADAEQVVGEIEQIFGSGEEPRVVKWRGMLELAKGNRNIAVRALHTTYEQFKASGRRDAQLSYTLAKIFENTAELGAAAEFLANALSISNRSLPDKIDEIKPEALLDYADILLKLRNYGGVLNIVNFFENKYWSTQRSQTLRINAYIASRQFNEAEKALAKAGRPDDPNTIKLNLSMVQAKIRQVQRAISQKQMKESLDRVPGAEKEGTKGAEGVDEMTSELKGYNDTLAELVENLLSMEPNSVGEASVVAVCNNYMEEGKFKQAEAIVNRVLEYFPDSAMLLFYKQILSEPQPGKLSQQRRKEIKKQVLSNISDPIVRAMSLGMFYQKNNEPNEAAEEFKKVLGSRLRANDGASPAEAEGEKITDSQRLAVNYLFEIALKAEDWQLVSAIVDIARRENLDDCEGRFFAARLAAAKAEYKDALAKLDECLKQKPVFSYGFILRSSVNAALGNESASIEDARKAAFLNPLDGNIAKGLANALYQRNRRLGDNVTGDELTEAKEALAKAIRLNPVEWQLQGLYAEYISEENPSAALAIRQRLQVAFPSVGNALLLGRMAMRMALREVNAERKEFLFSIAASSFEQAKAYEPQNKDVLNSYAEYYRLSGHPDMAEKLLAQSQDKKLLYSHYLRTSQFAKARRIMEELYRSDPKDIDAVKGLLLVAEASADREAAKKYSEELLSLDGNIENRLFQIQVFLKLGLIKEAEYKLQSFKETFPDEPRALLLEAWLVMRRGQLKKALELANRSLESNQDNAVAWRLRGEMNLLMANYDQAIIDLKRSESLSDDPVTRLTLAKAYLRAGREEDAITELKNVIDNPQAPAEGITLLEQVYWRLGRKDSLKSFYDETLKKFPDSVSWYNRAGAFATAVSDFGRAEQLYRQAWQKAMAVGDKNADEAFNGYLKALLLGGKLDKLFEEAQKYVDGDFASIAFIAMAEAKLKLDDRVTAIQYCRKAVDKAGTDEALGSWVLQRMYSLLGAEEVVRVCKEKLQADPDSLAANFTMFNLRRVNGEYNNAIGYIDKCLEIVGPDSPRRVDYIVKKVMVLQLAYRRSSNNNYLERAITEYESLLAEMPNNAEVLNNLAYMLAEGNIRLAEALAFAERAYEARPNNPGFLDTYAYVLYKNGKFPEAAEFLQASLQQFEQNRISAPADVYEHLGMIKEKLGEVAQALAAYKQSLEIMSTDGSGSKTAGERIKKAIERLSREIETEK